MRPLCRSKLWGGQGKLNSFSGITKSSSSQDLCPHEFMFILLCLISANAIHAVFSFWAWLRMHLVQSVVFIIILRCSFHIICKIIHMSRFSFRLLCPRLTRRVSPPTLARHKSQPNERPDRWKQKTLRIKHCSSMKTTKFLPPMWPPAIRAEATQTCVPTLRWWPQLILLLCPPLVAIKISPPDTPAPGTSDINKYQGNAAGVGPAPEVSVVRTRSLQSVYGGWQLFIADTICWNVIEIYQLLMNVLDVTWPDKYFYKFTALLTIIPYNFS